MKDLNEVVKPYDLAIAALEEAHHQYRMTGLTWDNRELVQEDIQHVIGQIVAQRRRAIEQYRRHAEAVASGPRSPVARTALVVIPGGGAA